MPHRLFEITEILYLVLGQLASPRDTVRLARVCRCLFDQCMPVAWRHVSSVLRIFNLIPGVRTTWSGVLTTIILPESLTEENLSRFHLYASFIDILKVSIRHGPCPWKLCNWNWLFEYSRNRPLLPKLQTLVFISRDRARSHSLAPISVWLTLFLSPSLLHFQVADPPNYPTFISQLEAYFIFRSLACICPDLHTLGFFWDDLYGINPRKAEWSYLLSNEETSTHHDLSPLFARLKCLTSLRTHIRRLGSLSPDTLSRLEWLDVTNIITLNGLIGGVKIPYTLLTSLKHIGILECAATIVLETLPMSVVTLTSVEIDSKLDGDLIHQVTSNLAMFCPLLTDLALHAGSPSIEAGSLAPLALIAHLRRLCITCSKNLLPAPQSDVFSYIHDLLPGLKTLEFRDEGSAYRKSQMLLLECQGSSTIF
ncbi:hypothetical protein FRC12_004526 [Ceratobasidium sp. 428]|nr:hypothetical protein FRC12_004526 [Ceratobasidium sp. 428]